STHAEHLPAIAKPIRKFHYALSQFSSQWEVGPDLDRFRKKLERHKQVILEKLVVKGVHVEKIERLCIPLFKFFTTEHYLSLRIHLFQIFSPNLNETDFKVINFDLKAGYEIKIKHVFVKLKLTLNDLIEKFDRFSNELTEYCEDW